MGKNKTKIRLSLQLWLVLSKDRGELDKLSTRTAQYHITALKAAEPSPSSPPPAPGGVPRKPRCDTKRTRPLPSAYAYSRNVRRLPADLRRIPVLFITIGRSSQFTNSQLSNFFAISVKF